MSLFGPPALQNLWPSLQRSDGTKESSGAVRVRHGEGSQADAFAGRPKLPIAQDSKGKGEFIVLFPTHLPSPWRGEMQNIFVLLSV